MVAISSDGPIWTLDLGPDENRFTATWLDQVGAALDELEASEGPAALVTYGSGRFFSNGLDVAALGAGPEELSRYVDHVHGLLSRLLTLPIPTVAAINGHAFGAGAMVALAHDFRVMRADRGYFCLPEVDLRIPFTPGMNALLVAKMTPQAQVASMLTGRRFTAEEAVQYGIVDAFASREDLLGVAAVAATAQAGKDRNALGTIKSVLYANATTALAIPHNQDRA